jgi:hypothetical protein
MLEVNDRNHKANHNGKRTEKIEAISYTRDIHTKFCLQQKDCMQNCEAGTSGAATFCIRRKLTCGSGWVK